VTSQGSASARFQRAIKQGNLFQAELAAKEMGTLPLGYALDLCRLLGESGDPRFERAAVRWHGRFVVERGITTVAESQLLLAAVADLPNGRGEVTALIRRIATEHRIN
jgi:hypothetical protein